MVLTAMTTPIRSAVIAVPRKLSPRKNAAAFFKNLSMLCSLSVVAAAVVDADGKINEYRSYRKIIKERG